MPDVDEELDRLYSVPLDEFTQARNDLARRLAKAGRQDAADEVKQLAKPSVPVWAANQLARREPGEVRALLRSAEELRKTQQRALAGKGGADLQARLTEQRQAVRSLARLGRELLAENGRSASEAIVERIAKTLDAAALDESARPLLRAGRLTEELEPPGFEALAGMAAASARRGKAPAKPKTGGRAEARRRVQAAQREARARSREAQEAERRLEQAEAAVATAREQAREARERADDAERELADAEAALRGS